MKIVFNGSVYLAAQSNVPALRMKRRGIIKEMQDQVRALNEACGREVPDIRDLSNRYLEIGQEFSNLATIQTKLLPESSKTSLSEYSEVAVQRILGAQLEHWERRGEEMEKHLTKQWLSSFRKWLVPKMLSGLQQLDEALGRSELDAAQNQAIFADFLKALKNGAGLLGAYRGIRRE